MKPATVLLTGAAILALQAPASAQSFQGHIRGESGEALTGAFVALIDASGREVGAALSDASGAFSVTPPGAGSYTVRADAPGYEVVELALVGGASTGHALQLHARPVALDVPSSDISPDRRCRVSSDDAARIGALWTEVRKALRATAHAEDTGIHGQEQRTWTRHLDPDDLKPVDESHIPVSGFRPGPPFRSPPPEELAQFGFIQGGDGEGYAFFAPDTRTLLSPVFTESHCLGFASEGPEEGWVGLTFRPRFEGGLDVAGTLWIDGRTLGPQRLEFHYTDLPWSLKTDKVGGRVDFHRLDQGPWVIHRWWIRSPRVGVRNVRVTQWDEPRQRFGLASVVEEGGEVVRIRFRDGRVESLAAAGS